MKNLVDSCGWLEYFSEGTNVGFFAPVIENVKNLIVPVICIYEVFKKVYNEVDEDSALQVAALMNQGCVVAIDDKISICAAKLSVEYKIPMADSIILAVSRLEKAKIWTQDDHFKNIKDVKYISKKGKI